MEYDSGCQMDGIFNVPQNIVLKGITWVLNVTSHAWLELSVVTDEWHWLKSHPHSIQQVPDIYPAGQFWVFFSFCGIWTQHITSFHGIANWTLKNWQCMAQCDESQFQLFWVDVWPRILWSHVRQLTGQHASWLYFHNGVESSNYYWLGLLKHWLMTATLHCFMTICHLFTDSLYLNNNELFHLLIGPKLSRIGFRNILETFDKWCNHNICMTWADFYRTLHAARPICMQ